MKQVDQVRVRFAPSPTGHLHIGGLRAALFNWLFARHHNGVFLLRIEDTDIERSLPEYTASILDSLQWCSLESSEPLLIQSSRLPEHSKALQALLATGKAYHCYCTPEDIQARQKAQYGDDIAFAKYDGFCRRRTDKPTGPAGIRFAIPDDCTEITFQDLIRGTVTFGVDQLDDFIIARSDGYPLYNFVVVQDDAFMRITHVIRGEEHLSNTPKQILLYQASGYSVPQFAHVPLILGPDGNKLSKRDAATSVLDYKRDGYLPEALLNYLVRLGWSHGDQELFTREELIRYFDLDHVGKKGAIFDKEKLDWVNSVYLRALTAEQVYEYAITYVEPELLEKFSPWTREEIIGFMALYQERVKTVRELVEVLGKLRISPEWYNEQDVQTWMTPEARAYIALVEQRCAAVEDFSVEAVRTAVTQLCKELGIKLVVVAQPIRLALVGAAAGPGVFELLALLGKKESLQRLRSLGEWVKKG